MMVRLRGIAASTVASTLLLLATFLQAQGTPPAAPLTLISREGRRAVPTTLLSGQELIALDEVATLFGVTVREDTLAGGLTVAYRGRTVLISADQPMASVSGRVVTLPSPAVRAGTRWLVPVEFLPRALAPIYDRRIDLRRPSRLLIVGDLRVPRVVARVDGLGPPTRVTLEATPSTPVVTQTEPGRIVLRFEADALDLALPTAGASLVDQIRAGDQPSSVLLALNPRAGVPRIATTVTDDGTRVVIEVPLATGTPPVETSAPRTETPPATPPASPPAPDGPPVLAAAGLQTIVIDPGHGGADTGVRGAGGVEEKAVTLEVARRLRGLIETRLGIRVILTRDDDRAVAPDERAALANNSKADLFLSLHANAAPAPGVAGAEVFHLRLDREAEDARRLAAAESVALPVVSGGTRPIEVVRWDLAQARHVESSAVLAGLLEEELRLRVPMGSRPRQQAPLRVLVAANMPAALVEMAYLTNPAQAQAARRDDYQALVAQALYEAIGRFRAHAAAEAP